MLPLILMGCHMPLIRLPHETIDLESYCQKPPCHTSAYFTWFQVPCPQQADYLIQQADDVVSAVFQWLECDRPVKPIRLLILSPHEPAAQVWLKKHSIRHEVAGQTIYADNLLVMVGDPNHPRFATVLRHEAAHFAFYGAASVQTMPFWLSEGVACLYETGVDQNGHPRPNPERLALLRYLARTRSSLGLKNLIKKQHAQGNGMNYARAWGIVAYLCQTDGSVNKYLHTLRTANEKPLTLFENTFLNSDEGITAFDQAVTDWMTQL